MVRKERIRRILSLKKRIKKLKIKELNELADLFAKEVMYRLKRR